jgi:hypothetical protein
MISGVKIGRSLKVCVIVVIWIILRCLRQTYVAESLLVLTDQQRQFVGG